VNTVVRQHSARQPYMLETVQGMVLKQYLQQQDTESALRLMRSLASAGQTLNR
jgi:hypothetical protein